MRPLVGGPPYTLLGQLVFDTQGHPMGRVGAVATRHGELRRIGIESLGPAPAPLRFVPSERLTVEPDGVIVTP